MPAFGHIVGRLRNQKLAALLPDTYIPYKKRIKLLIIYKCSSVLSGSYIIVCIYTRYYEWANGNIKTNTQQKATSKLNFQRP